MPDVVTFGGAFAEACDVHNGRYVIIARDGRTIWGATANERPSLSVSPLMWQSWRFIRDAAARLDSFHALNKPFVAHVIVGRDGNGRWNATLTAVVQS
jgi:hypothetical protein